jgi:hypothetical protein
MCALFLGMLNRGWPLGDVEEWGRGVSEGLSQLSEAKGIMDSIFFECSYMLYSDLAIHLFISRYYYGKLCTTATIS